MTIFETYIIQFLELIAWDQFSLRDAFYNFIIEAYIRHISRSFFGLCSATRERFYVQDPNVFRDSLFSVNTIAIRQKGFEL